MKIKTGDQVSMLTGKDKGKTGKVLQVLSDRAQVVVEGCNIRLKNVRARKQGEQGQRIQFPSSVPLSAVMLVCPKCNKLTRVGYQLPSASTEGIKAKKVRRCVRCKQTID